MTMLARTRTIAIVCSLIAASAIFDGSMNSGIFISNAEARIGRPMTPISVAGVSRRTTRRVIRRTAVVAATLPRGCTTVVIDGTTLSQCGGTYYQAQGNQYVIVNVN